MQKNGSNCSISRDIQLQNFQGTFKFLSWKTDDFINSFWLYLTFKKAPDPYLPRELDKFSMIYQILKSKKKVKKLFHKTLTLNWQLTHLNRFFMLESSLGIEKTKEFFPRTPHRSTKPNIETTLLSQVFCFYRRLVDFEYL